MQSPLTDYEPNAVVEISSAEVTPFHLLMAGKFLLSVQFQ